MLRNKGFTLLEILIALFIFSILSLIFASSLHNVINLQSGTERNAERLRDLQLALLLISRDVEQAINRPIVGASGKEEPAFKGAATQFTFTHTGWANPTGTAVRSTLQRTGYQFHEGVLTRITWEALDQAPNSRFHTRQLLQSIQARFEYLDQNGHFQTDWPAKSETRKQPLPRAVRVYLSIPEWGELSQLYVISTQTIENPKTQSES